MSVLEQALSLLDVLPSVLSRKKLENFSSLDPEINASLPGSTVAAAPAATATESLYSVASRMGRPDYEENAKAEALLHALRQMRAKNARKPSRFSSP